MSASLYRFLENSIESLVQLTQKVFQYQVYQSQLSSPASLNEIEIYIKTMNMVYNLCRGHWCIFLKEGEVRVYVELYLLFDPV